jgi:hypothetical protein
MKNRNAFTSNKPGNHSTGLLLPTAKVTPPTENNADSLHSHKLGTIFGPCDFHVWGSLKYKVYKTNSHTLEETISTSAVRFQQLLVNSRE